MGGGVFMDVGGSRKRRRDQKGCAQTAVIRWANVGILLAVLLAQR